MRLISKAVLAAIFLTSGADAVLAKPTIYTCHNSSNRTQSVIQGEMVISYDVETKEVFVSDALILNVVGKPIAAKLNSDNDKRVVFSWKVKNVANAEGKYATLQFKGTYFKADKTFLLSMQPLGYDNSFQDRGTCKVK